MLTCHHLKQFNNIFNFRVRFNSARINNSVFKITQGKKNNCVIKHVYVPLDYIFILFLFDLLNELAVTSEFAYVKLEGRSILPVKQQKSQK